MHLSPLAFGEVGKVQVVNQLTKYSFQSAQELINALETLKNRANLLIVMLNSFKVFLVVGELSSQYFIHVLRFDHLLDLGRAEVSVCVDVSFLAEDLSESFETFLESDGVCVEERYVAGNDYAIVLVFLLLIEGGNLCSVVSHLLHSLLIVILVLLYSQSQVREFKVLLFQPIHQLAAILIAPRLCFVLLQLLLLILQVL